MQAFEQLELEWARFNDLDPVGMVCCSSGTSALHLSLEAMKVPLGSEVLTGDFSMIAVARAIVMAGLIPVFVDCTDNLLMDCRLIEQHLDGNPIPNVAAVLAVHIYGRRCDMDQVHAIMNNDCTNGYVIEDLAEAHGVRPHKDTDAACWSFQQTKHVHGEEGGAVWFRDVKHAELARKLRCLGFQDKHDYDHLPRGWNYRLANSLAELVLASLTRFDQSRKEMREAELELDLCCPQGWKMPRRDATWIYDFRVPGMTKRQQDEAVTNLKSKGIRARHGFRPMSLQEEFKKCRVIGDGKSLIASREIIYVPLSKISLPFFDIVKSAIQDVSNFSSSL